MLFRAIAGLWPWGSGRILPLTPNTIIIDSAQADAFVSELIGNVVLQIA
jgi:ABC-type uncharacterized transport system fused permease/ATPase subunit